MSESDDSDILADIQALDEALSLSAKKKSQQHVQSSEGQALLDVEDSDNNDYLDYIYANNNIDESLNAYDINTRLINGLTIAKKQLILLLKECEEKIKLLDEKLISKDKWSAKSKLAIHNAGMPYFKDKDYFGAPKNYDTKLKEARGELFLPYLKKLNRWSGKDREVLLSAISNQAIESVLKGEFNMDIDKITNDQVKQTKSVLPKNFREMVGAVGEKNFDWYKISVIDFDNKHSPGECQTMWNVYLHPDITKKEWTNEEDNKLWKCVKQYKYQDWDGIAQKLGTNRSAYQCFIRYNTIKKVPSSGYPWTKQEDRYLAKIINELKIGNYLPWSDIANHIRYRTKQQIYVRWMYRKAPHLRKGRFTHTETSNLLKAVQKYGKNFVKISNVVMPHRTSAQLQEHYNTIMKSKINLWTLNDDVTLIDLQSIYRNNWSKIATYFSNKTRTQVRHRFNALLKYVDKGISLENIPRPPPMHNKKLPIKKNSANNVLTNCDKITLYDRMQSTVQNSDIQLRLYETLCFPPSVKFNNSEECYDVNQLALETKKLHNILNILNINIPNDFLSTYVQCSKKESQLLCSLKEYVNMSNKEMQNSEVIEKYRMQMFGGTPEINKNDFFIPPLPFDGYVRTKKSKTQKTTSINYSLNANEKFLIDVPTCFFVNSDIQSFITTEEENQFYKLGHFISKCNHYCTQDNINLYKSVECIIFLPKKSNSSNENPLKFDELNINSEVNMEDLEQSNTEWKETSSNEEKETNVDNIILPNSATLLGWKNLLLWKLLYDYKNEQQCKSKMLCKKEQTVTKSQQVRSAEYQLLRTRLVQLFKFPIGLANTMIQMHETENIFSTKEKSQIHADALTIPQKRKLKNTISTQSNKKDKVDVPINSDSQLNSRCVSTTRKRKIIRRNCKENTKNS